MRTTEYLIYFGNLFEAAQFFDEFNEIPAKEYRLIAKNHSFCHIKIATPFQVSIVWKLSQTVVKVKEYRKGKVKYTTIKERTC